MVIKAVLFDYFGVISSDEYWRYVREDKNMQAGFHELSDQVNRGKISWQDFEAIVAERTGTSRRAVHAMYEQARIDPRVLAYAHDLHETYKTALVTNAHHEFLDPIVSSAHLSNVFDQIILSSRIGATKPQPRIYEVTAQTLGVMPEECIFIDDIGRNVDGAEAVGMHGVLYQDLVTCKSVVKKILKQQS